MDVIAVAVKSGFKMFQAPRARCRAWIMTALRFFVSLHCSIESCDILRVGRFGERSPNTSNLLPVQIEQTYVSRMWAMEIPCVSGVKNSCTCGQLYFLSSTETQVDKIRWNFRCWFWLVIVSVSLVMFFAFLPHVALEAILFLPEPHCSSTSMCQWSWLFGQFATVMSSGISPLESSA